MKKVKVWALLEDGAPFINAGGWLAISPRKPFLPKLGVTRFKAVRVEIREVPARKARKRK